MRDALLAAKLLDADPRLLAGQFRKAGPQIPKKHPPRDGPALRRDVTEPRPLITIAALAAYLQLVPEVVAIAWEEWGKALADDPRERWLREAELDSRLHLPTSAGFVAWTVIASLIA